MEIDDTPLKKKPVCKNWPATAAVVFLLLTTVVLLIKNFHLKRQLEIAESSNIFSNQLVAELEEKEEEIKLCIEDKPQYGDPIVKPYSFPELGIYSPDFEGQEILITSYDYKRNVIVHKSIRPSDDTNQSWGIDVWELQSHTSHLPFLEGYSSFGTQYDFPIFDGYKNYETPQWISKKIIDWQEKESYTNKNGIKMYLSYKVVSRSSIGQVRYEFYIPNSARGKQSFVEIWNSVDDPIANDVNDLSVLEAKQELKNFADNINMQFVK